MSKFNHSEIDFKNLRMKAGLSQGQVAQTLKYSSPQFVSNWERKLAYPPPATFKPLAKILGVDVKILINDFLKVEKRFVLEEVEKG